MTEERVRIGIVGIGNMGKAHVKHVTNLSTTELVAVCDRQPTRLEEVDIPDCASRYTDFIEMLDTVPLDAVIIATPHFSHPDMCLAAFERGKHVLVEKPIAVHIKEAQRMIAGYQAAKGQWDDLVFAAMFMQRTWSHWRKIKAMIDSGALGRLQRCTWLITDWFRTQHYYDSGEWRATWSGEGGGVLMNQCPHNLDLYQWLVGLPARVRGFVQFGKHHRIEVEDEVTAYFEHVSPPGEGEDVEGGAKHPGMVGHFITTTGESPGTNRLEIVGDLGKLVYEAAPPKLPDAADPAAAEADDAAEAPTESDSAADQGAGSPSSNACRGDSVSRPPPADQAAEAAPDDLIFYRNARSSIDEIRQSQQGFTKVPYQREVVPYTPRESHGHEVIIANFADAILRGAELIAPAAEGLNSVMLNNAIILSAHKQAAVELSSEPTMIGDEFAALLQAYIKEPPA